MITYAKKPIITVLCIKFSAYENQGSLFLFDSPDYFPAIMQGKQE